MLSLSDINTIRRAIKDAPVRDGHPEHMRDTARKYFGLLIADLLEDVMVESQAFPDVWHAIAPHCAMQLAVRLGATALDAWQVELPPSDAEIEGVFTVFEIASKPSVEGGE